MLKVIDFDELFNRYFEKWYRENRGKYNNIDEMENAMPKVYETFLQQPNAELGCCPRDYFSGRSPEELLAALLEYVERGVPVSDMLLKTLEKSKGAEEAVYRALTQSRIAEYSAILMNLLGDLKSSLCFGLFADWILNGSVDATLRELAVELLGKDERGVDFAKDRLLTAAPRADEATRLLIADVAVNAAGDERAYKLLTELFLSAEDIALTSSYLGKFGDVRAIPLLDETIRRDDICYAEFIELRNAIERLGGTAEVNRTFENDPTYHALRGIK